MSERKLAVIRGVHLRYDYCGGPSLAFDTYWEEGVAALQVLRPRQTVALLKAYEMRQLSELEGRTVWVQHDPHHGSALGSSVYDGPANLGAPRE